MQPRQRCAAAAPAARRLAATTLRAASGAGRRAELGELEWSRAIADSSHVQAKKGAPRRVRARWTEAVPAPSTTLLVDGSGTPLAFAVTGGNRNDVTPLIPILDESAQRGELGCFPVRRESRLIGKA
jgi:hypothetical protein